MGETESQSSSSTQSMSTGSGVAAASEAGQVNQGSAAPPAAQPQPQEQQQPAATEGPKKKKWQPLTVPSPMQIIQEDAMNNCLVKGTISCVMGGVAGLAFGLFTASIENAGPNETLTPEMRERPTREVLREMARNMKDKSVSYAKGFAYFGALYSFNECVIEKYRAKHDKVNPALAGCATGAMMAYGGGPSAMCLGCVSVGAFSLAIEHFLGL